MFITEETVEKLYSCQYERLYSCSTVPQSLQFVASPFTSTLIPSDIQSLFATRNDVYLCFRRISSYG